MLLQSSGHILDLRRDTACIADVEARMVAQLAPDASARLQGSDAASAAAYHLASGGQRVRAEVALDAALKLGVPAEDAIALAAGVELLHNASLIHDDVQDRSRSRRDRASVWLLYGDNVAVCAGDLLISAAYRALSSFTGTHLLPELLGLAHDCVARSIKGQCADLSSSRPPGADIGHYEAVAAEKSGALLSLPLELALVAAGRRDALPLARTAAEAFAVGYQVCDDIADIADDAGEAGNQPPMNILLMLRAAGLDASADSTARSLGRMHLQAAASLANELPNGSGDLLRSLALRFSAKL